MNGPEHYREAERLLAAAAVRPTDRPEDCQRRTDDELVSAAQVHATLALAAATVASSSTYDAAAGTSSDTWCSEPGWPEAIA